MAWTSPELTALRLLGFLAPAFPSESARWAWAGWGNSNVQHTHPQIFLTTQTMIPAPFSSSQQNNHAYPTLIQSSFETLKLFSLNSCWTHIFVLQSQQLPLAWSPAGRAVPGHSNAWQTNCSIYLFCRASLDSWLHSRTSASSSNQAAHSQQSWILRNLYPELYSSLVQSFFPGALNSAVWLNTDQQQHLSTERRFQLHCSSESIHKISQYNCKNKLCPVTVQKEEEKWILNSHGSNHT